MGWLKNLFKKSPYTKWKHYMVVTNKGTTYDIYQRTHISTGFVEFKHKEQKFLKKSPLY